MYAADHHGSPRGAWNIPKEGPVLFICAPHANQFLDPLLLFTEVRRESGRRTAILTAAKSMERKFIGFIARLFNSSEYKWSLLRAPFLTPPQSPSLVPPTMPSRALAV